MPQRDWLLRPLTAKRRTTEKIFKWTLPAGTVQLPEDDRDTHVCPNAGICLSEKLCYALHGTFMFRNVREKHMDNLRMVKHQSAEWERRMTEELQHKRYAGNYVRIHDAGDFFTDRYLKTWLRIIRATPGVKFYTYTKEVSRFRRLVEPDPPANFGWCYSLGGKQDRQINTALERHADVFPDEEAIEAAGYSSQSMTDVLAVEGPPHVGIPANNLRHVQAIQGDKSFGERQADHDRRRAAERASRRS